MAVEHQTDATVQNRLLRDILHFALDDLKVAMESAPRLLVGCNLEEVLAL